MPDIKKNYSTPTAISNESGFDRTYAYFKNAWGRHPEVIGILCSSVIRGATIVLGQPLHAIRILQNMPDHSLGISKAYVHIIKIGGFSALWDGFGVKLGQSCRP
ncbi:MAG TPA: hypothetical protein VD770_02305 [Coxiellaceae bacterium]|nr:hypothetical protein [Coxiellaceae bacterium]